MKEVIRIEYKRDMDIYSNRIKSVPKLFYNNILQRFDSIVFKEDNFSEIEEKIEKMDHLDDNIEPTVSFGGENLEVTIDAESTVLVLKNDKYDVNEKNDIVNNSIEILKENFNIVNIGIQFNDNISDNSNEFIKKYICPLLLKGREEKLIHSRLIYSFEEDNGIISTVFTVNRNQKNVSFVSQIVNNFIKDYVFNYEYSYSKYLKLKSEINSKIHDNI